MSTTTENPYRPVPMPPSQSRSLVVEYRDISGEIPNAIKVLLWFAGILLTGFFGYEFYWNGLDRPEVVRLGMETAIYWVVWSLRYVKISFR